MRLGGRLFPYGSVDHLVGAGGGDVLCIPGIGAGTPGGGLRLEGATRLLLGVGARLPHGPIQAEVTLGVGGINGHPGYSVRGTETAKRVLPHIGAGFSLVIVRHVVLAFDPGWTRLTNSWLPDQGTSETKTSWQRMQIWRIGLRLGVPENQKESSH